MDTQKSLLFKNEHTNDRNEQHESYIVPEVFQNCLVKVSDIHSHNTRCASNLNFHVPRTCKVKLRQTQYLSLP